MNIASQIASMITFQYRHRYILGKRRRVRFIDFSHLENYYYDKRNVIEEIESRNHMDSWYEPTLLKSEMWNLDEAIEEAKQYYVKMSRVILTYTHFDDEDIDDYLESMKQVIDNCKERKKLEVAKREGKLKEYIDKMEILLDNEISENYC